MGRYLKYTLTFLVLEEKKINNRIRMENQTTAVFSF